MKMKTRVNGYVDIDMGLYEMISRNNEFRHNVNVMKTRDVQNDAQEQDPEQP